MSSYFSKSEEIPDGVVMRSTAPTRSGKRTYKQNTTNYSALNKTVKVIKRENVTVTKFNVKRAKQFKKSLDETPMYLISAHSCICPSTGECFGEKKPFSFAIPPDTYIASLVQVGDFFCGDQSDILLHKDHIRTFMSLTSESDVYMMSGVGTSTFSFFSGIMRATSLKDEPVLYPNINFTVNEHIGKDKTKLKKPEDNDNGVYAIDKLDKSTTLNNTLSIIPQGLKRDNLFLQDIITEVYTKTGISKGIFILAGCLETCKATKQDMDSAAGLIHLANVKYPYEKTFTSEQFRKAYGNSKLALNMGVFNPITSIAPREIREMAKADLTDPRIYKELPKLYHPTNVGEVTKLMKQYGK